MTRAEATQLGTANAETAMDQADNYLSLPDALFAYWINLDETLKEREVTPYLYDVAFNAFYNFLRENGIEWTY